MTIGVPNSEPPHFSDHFEHLYAHKRPQMPMVPCIPTSTYVRPHLHTWTHVYRCVPLCGSAYCLRTHCTLLISSDLLLFPCTACILPSCRCHGCSGHLGSSHVTCHHSFHSPASLGLMPTSSGICGGVRLKDGFCIVIDARTWSSR